MARILLAAERRRAKDVMRTIRARAWFILSILLAITLAQAPGRSLGQAGEQSAPQPRKTSPPYTGDLSIFETAGREERLQLNRVMEMLGVEPGKSVADIGAGSGWFTVRAARRVTDSGIVYAVDINREAIDYIERRVEREQLHNVKTVLSSPDNPGLPATSVDSVLLLKTYHEVAQPVALLSNLRPALRPGARLGIIDRNGKPENHGVAKETVIKEAAQAGYKLKSESDFVKGDDMDYFLIFAVK